MATKITSSYWTKAAIIIGVFLLTMQLPVDLDLGWHLRYGEYFFQTGNVLKENILSTIWPDYQWVQASWGYDLILYQLFRLFGFWGISITGAIVSTLIFWILIRPMRLRSPANILFLTILFLTQTVPLYASSFRSQTPSALMFALLLVLMSPTGLTSGTYILFLPLLFLAWANLHGGFALGLIISYIIWLSTGILKTLSFKRWIVIGGIIMLSTATPLLNPWGVRIYEETLKHSTNINLAIIGEWMPMTTDRIATTLLIIVFLAVLWTAWKRRRLPDLPFIAAYFFVTYLSLTALRFVINFGLMSTWYMAQNGRLNDWVPARYSTHVVRIAPFILFVIVFLEILFVRQYFFFSLPQLVNFNWHTYCQFQNACSEEITLLMRTTPPMGTGFNPYNYGGYLSWRVPEVKTFTDGRMAAWQDEHGNTPPVIDADRIYEDSKPLMFRRFDAEYHFSWLILPTNSTLNDYLEKMPQWRIVYGDNRFRYYIRE